MDDEGSAARATEILARILPVVPERVAQTVRLTSEDGARILIDALRALDEAGLVPAKLAVHEPSLDDVFLSLTGHRAEDVAQAPAEESRAEARTSNASAGAGG